MPVLEGFKGQLLFNQETITVGKFSGVFFY